MLSFVEHEIFFITTEPGFVTKHLIIQYLILVHNLLHINACGGSVRSEATSNRLPIV